MLKRIKNQRVRIGLIQMKIGIEERLLDAWCIFLPVFIFTGISMACFAFWFWVFKSWFL